jgi:hypothetical protein
MAEQKRPDDSELIDEMEGGAGQSGASGGNLQRDIGSRAEQGQDGGDDQSVTRVRDSDKKDGANLPRFNQR